jgi:hypothetical protein
MLVSISQPTLFPWIGYFNIIKQSDIFVFFDNVKFEKRSWQMRNKLKLNSKENESEISIKIPTTIEKSDIMIKDVKIDNTQKWKIKHLKTFNSNYGKSFDEINFLKEHYEKDWNFISDFNIEFIKKCSEYLGIKTKFVKSSELKTHGKKSFLLLDICKQLGATDYLTSIGAIDYLEKDKKTFEESNIKIRYHEYIHPIYKQKGNKFLEKLSVLDLIFNEKDNSKKYI